MLKCMFDQNTGIFYYYNLREQRGDYRGYSFIARQASIEHIVPDNVRFQ